MPVSVRKGPDGWWLIVEKATGKVKGKSRSKQKAKISAAIRNREAGY